MNNRNKFAGVVVGLCFLALGLSLFGKAVGLWDNVLFDGWWTLFLIVPGIASIVKSGFNFFNTGLTAIGAILFLEQYDLFDDVKTGPIIWGVLMVLIGVGIITGQFKTHKYKNCNPNHTCNGDNTCYTSASAGTSEAGDQAQTADEQGASQNQNTEQNQSYYQQGGFSHASNESMDYPVHTSIFAGDQYKIISADLKGADLTTVFGGIDIDFSQAAVNKNIVVKAYAIFGGIDIIAPRGVKVQLDSTSVFGGCDNKAPELIGENLPTVTVKAYAIFGGIDIK